MRKLEEMLSDGVVFLGYSDSAASDTLRLKNGNFLSRQMVCGPILQFSVTKMQDGVQVQYQQLSGEYVDADQQGFEQVKAIVSEYFSFDDNSLQLALSIWKSPEFAAKLVECATDGKLGAIFHMRDDISTQDCLKIRADQLIYCGDEQDLYRTAAILRCDDYVPIQFSGIHTASKLGYD